MQQMIIRPSQRGSHERGVACLIRRRTTSTAPISRGSASRAVRHCGAAKLGFSESHRCAKPKPKAPANMRASCNRHAPVMRPSCARCDATRVPLEGRLAARIAATPSPLLLWPPSVPNRGTARLGAGSVVDDGSSSIASFNHPNGGRYASKTARARAHTRAGSRQWAHRTVFHVGAHDV